MILLNGWSWHVLFPCFSSISVYLGVKTKQTNYSWWRLQLSRTWLPTLSILLTKDGSSFSIVWNWIWAIRWTRWWLECRPQFHVAGTDHPGGPGHSVAPRRCRLGAQLFIRVAAAADAVPLALVLGRRGFDSRPWWSDRLVRNILGLDSLALWWLVNDTPVRPRTRLRAARIIATTNVSSLYFKRKFSLHGRNFFQTMVSNTCKIST